MQKHKIDFRLGYSESLEAIPEETVEAIVPGAVQLDWEKAKGWEPYYKGDNYKKYKWMEDKFWHYYAKIDMNKFKSKSVFLCSKGIDYRYQVKLNGELIYSHEGMYTPFEIEISDFTGVFDLEIIIFPVPQSHNGIADRSQANKSCKPPVSYGWDFHPRLIPLGIWDEIYILERNQCHIKVFDFYYDLSDDLSFVDFKITLSTSKCNFDYEIEIENHLGKTVFSQKGKSISEKIFSYGTLKDISLWWPNGFGESSLYTVYIYIKNSGKIDDFISRKIGFRKVELVMHEGAWDEPSKMPKTRSNPPVTMLINGRRIFCKGSNLILPEIFYGSVTKEKYKELILLAVNANFNIFRIWGGSVVFKEEFYDLCDEHGLMIWQEFPLACNKYPDNPEYLNVLDIESKTLINKLKIHPCLSIWCGGNELFNKWSQMTDQSLPLRLLNKNCYDLDVKTPFISTSPLAGMAHGHYLFYDEEEDVEVFALINNSDFTAYPEFACPGMSDVDILKEALTDEEIENFGNYGNWVIHNGFESFRPTGWSMPEITARYFGDTNKTQLLIERSQLMQSEALKAIFEETRRKQPKASMALNWCFNECWPAVAGTNIVSWKNNPKPAYYAVKSALRNVMVSARNKKFKWVKDENFESEIWVLNDSFEKQNIGEIIVSIVVDEKDYELCIWNIKEVPAQTNIKGPTANFKMIDSVKRTFKLKLTVRDNPKLNSEYYFVTEKQLKSSINSNAMNV